MKDEDGMATVLSHEIGHVVARHGAEKMIFFRLTIIIRLVLAFIFGFDIGFGPLIGIGLQLPYSRKLESEADHIGLLLMSRACYNPEKAPELWQRMKLFEKQTGKTDSELLKFVSTHPSHNKRIQNLKEWTPEALEEYEKSGCYNVGYLRKSLKKIPIKFFEN
jgi:Zn-dependent protease with chaperone function